MGASFTLAVILVMGLIVGWRHHFKAVAHRQRITELAAKAEKVRQSQAQPTGSTLVVAAPGMALPDQSSLLLGDSTPLRYNPNARLVPETSVIEALPLVNAGSVLAEAEQMVRGYMDTPNWQDRLKYVFEPQRVRSLMEDYYEFQRGVDPVMGALISQGRFRIDGVEIVLLTYRSARADGKLEIALRRSTGDRFVIDWESFVGYSEKSFSQLKTTKPSTPVLVRGLVQLHDYYNFEFSDAQKFLSVKVSAPDGDDFIHAYCLRESQMGRWLLQDLDGGPKDARPKAYTLWINYPEQAQSDRCVNLIQIPGRWLILPEK